MHAVLSFWKAAKSERRIIAHSASKNRPAWSLRPNYSKHLFQGTAVYYAEYRVPYPQGMFDDLLRRTNPSGNGCLLDLACGTGEIALPLRPFFREVWAVDQEPEMIEVGRRKTDRFTVENIRWMNQRAEEVEAPPRSFELITIGSAFHRLNRPLVARKAMQWLSPGCGVAVLGSNSVWTGREAWQSLAVDVIAKWRPDRETVGIQTSGPRKTHQDVLADAGFSEIVEFELPTPHVWTLDAFVGYLYSTSVVSRSALGNSVAKFETELRQTLLAFDPSGRYPETMDFYYILATRPASHVPLTLSDPQ